MIGIFPPIILYPNIIKEKIIKINISNIIKKRISRYTLVS